MFRALSAGLGTTSFVIRKAVLALEVTPADHAGRPHHPRPARSPRTASARSCRARPAASCRASTRARSPPRCW
ncbi:MAG: hypothetical protein MZV65_54115 [Chromatiales bacterium]|nr:hypothetical protein [Chromatiales bacterium]